MDLRSLRFKIKSSLRVKNRMIREFFAEFLGTFVFIAIGTGANAQASLSHGAYGQFLSIALAWGWAVAMGVWIAGGVSGAHLNPAITVAVAILGEMKWVKVPIYCLAQYLAAFVASACVYGLYYDALNTYDGGKRVVLGENGTAHIWTSFPQPFVSTLSGFGDQVFGTMLLVLCVMALIDKYNIAPDNRMLPFAVGGVITVIAMSFGLNVGSPINPAKDFGPRAFIACAGWGVEVFTVCNYWFWVPLVAPHIGAVCGALFYMVFVGIHAEPESSPSPVQLDYIDTKKENHEDRF